MYDPQQTTTAGILQRMGAALRFILLAAAAAFLAMFFEPFFSQILSLIGINTSDWALPMLTYFTQHLWLQLVGAGVIGAAVGAWLHSAATRFDRRHYYQEAAKDRKEKRFGVREQERLRQRLKEYTGPHYNADIEYSAVQLRPLAESIRDIFKLAGWAVNFTNVPIEHQTLVPAYWEGVRVRTYNKHLAESVAEALTEAGLYGVRPEIEINPIKRDNPKWNWVEHRVKIRIGHKSI